MVGRVEQAARTRWLQRLQAEAPWLVCFQVLCWNVLLLVRPLLFPLCLIRFASRHYSDSYICNCPSCCTPPRVHPRGQGYGRSFTTGQVRQQGSLLPLAPSCLASLAAEDPGFIWWEEGGGRCSAPTAMAGFT